MREKLLILGIDTATRFIIEEAKRKGLYIILTDYNPIEKVPLKKSVDEAWTLNVGAIDELEQKARKSGVTAVMAGNHEFCLDSAKILAERLDLPFYVGDRSWSIARNKSVFKQVCREVGFKTAEDYTKDQTIQYPVCVKPSDASAQRGFSVVYDPKDLDAACKKALSYSSNKKIIIEQFLTGNEVTLVGYVDHGICHFFYVGEIFNIFCGGKQCLSFSAHSPAYASVILKKYSGKFRKLMESIGYRNGLIILQGFLMEDGEYYPIETGLRFDGLVSSYFSKKIYGINPVGWMIDLARGRVPEIPESVWRNMNPCNPDYYDSIYCLYCNAGTISSAVGKEELEQLPGVVFMLDRFKLGDIVEDVGNMTQCAYYLHITESSPDELIQRLKQVNETIQLRNENGSNMLIYETEYARIKESILFGHSCG